MRSVKAAYRPAYLPGDIVEITGDKHYRNKDGSPMLLYVKEAEAGDYYAGVVGFLPHPEDRPIRFQRKELGRVMGNFRK